MNSLLLGLEEEFLLARFRLMSDAVSCRLSVALIFDRLTLPKQVTCGKSDNKSDDADNCNNCNHQQDLSGAPPLFTFSIGLG